MFKPAIKIFSRSSLILLVLSLLSAQNGIAQKKKKDKDNKDKPAAAVDKDAPKKIDEVVKHCARYDGLFTFYQDSVSGATHLLIEPRHLDKEFIYFSQFADGVLDAWTFRGNYNQSQIFRVQKYFNRIEFVFVNTSSYFDPKNPVSKASDANMSNSTLASLKITAMNDAKDKFLVDADQLFLRELFLQVKPPAFPGQKPDDFTLGELDKDKTKINHIRNYPKNTDLAVEYVYTKGNILNGGSRAIADGRYVSIKVYHSLIEMPQNDYVPVMDDPRIGYFTTEITDMTTLDPINYHDLIHRWHLKKKDPNASLSEPIEPITWWIENTTPTEIRPIIKHAGEQWNLAFEKAGFKNAVVIREQPDTASWDAGDIRYNVLRWTSSPDLAFGGYGPSFVNPRTGQILGADIMLEYYTLANSIRLDKLLGSAYGYESAEQKPERFAHQYCFAAQYARENNLFGQLGLKLMGASKLDESKMVNEFLHFLILHEMGHTLGLNHNMKSSQLHSIKDIHNTTITSKMGLTGSVMDYPAINFSGDRKNQGNYWTTVPGPYDHWAIEFAYKPGQSASDRENLLARSTEAQLMFGNDADDMREPGKAIDPRVMVNDMSSDAIQYSIDRIELVRNMSKEILKRYNIPGNSYQEHAVSYNILLNQQAISANTISRYIGGVYVDRAFVGQKGAGKPLMPVETEKQKQAMNALARYIFAPDAFETTSELYNYLQIQRRGFNFWDRSEDPKLHRRILGYQKMVLDHLMHPTTLQRIVDTKLYGNNYSIAEMMSDLTSAIFKSDIAGTVNSFRQNLQVEYTRRLIDILNGPNKTSYMNSIQSLAVQNLKEIRKMSSNALGDPSSMAHKDYLVTLVNNTLRELK
ncbi:MAG TPA: zinc-dependent metalloprotease [Bacteroidia bacterium]|nr:zinc-dependent metalloprotease [Bacteroidia bacterium]